MSLFLDTSAVTGTDPVYNPITYVVTSNNSTYINYKYDFNLYKGNTFNNLLSTIKLNPRPDGSCQYNPARILESITSADLLIQNITGRTDSQNSYQVYQIGFNEEFTGARFFGTNSFGGNLGFLLSGDNPFSSGDTISIVVDDGQTYSAFTGNYNVISASTNIVLISYPFTGTTSTKGTISYQDGHTVYYTGATTYSAYTFNGVLQYKDFPSWTPANYLVSPNIVIPYSPKLFLTNQPITGVYVKNLTDRGTLSYMDKNYNLSSIQLQVKVFPLSGGSQTYLLPISGGTQNDIHHLPSGPWNLNEAFGSEIINTNIGYYQLALIDLLHNPITVSQVYLMDQRCSKYDTVRLGFLNRLGTWDYVNMDMVSRTTINLTNRNTYKKLLNYNYQVGDREVTTIDMTGNYLYSVTSNWMNDAQSAWIEELFTSQNVNIINDDGSSWPVLFQDNSLEIQKSINQKMISYTFNLASSFNINTGRP